jgi:hypothetical protein
MKDLYSFLNESLLDDFDDLSHKSELGIYDGLLSNDEDIQLQVIDKFKQRVLASGNKRMKIISKIEWAETERWFVQFPKYKGYTWDILLFHRVGSNFYIYYTDKIKHQWQLVRRIESWAGSTGLKYNISPRENEIYELPKDLCDVCKRLEKRVTTNIKS